MDQSSFVVLERKVRNRTTDTRSRIITIVTGSAVGHRIIMDITMGLLVGIGPRWTFGVAGYVVFALIGRSAVRVLVELVWIS